LLPGTNFAGLASDLEVVFIPAKRALRPGPFLPSLASIDVPRRIASHFTSAGSLSSLVSEANLSTKLFLDCLCLLGAVGTGLAEGETGLCKAKTSQAEPDWLSDRFLPKSAFRPT